jgi:predicted O-methyltransferase YrrM
MASSTSVTADPRVLAYTQRLFAPEDAILAEIRERHRREGLPDIFISPEEAKIIAVLLAAIGAERVLEIGTLGGYSGVWIARALPETGTLITVERNPEHARFAHESFRRAGVSDRVDLREGVALAVLETLEPPFDVVFIDADKAALEQYYTHAMRLLRVGGLLLCDNVFLDGRAADGSARDPDVLGVRAFNRLASSDPRLAAAVIPVRDGLAFGVKVSD